jgi:hypothetical protein
VTVGPSAARVAVEINAFTGTEPATGPFADSYGGWAVGALQLGRRSAVPAPADPRCWQDHRIGWGVVLPERPGLDADALTRADDAPAPVQELVTA